MRHLCRLVWFNWRWEHPSHEPPFGGVVGLLSDELSSNYFSLLLQQDLRFSTRLDPGARKPDQPDCLQRSSCLNVEGLDGTERVVGQDALTGLVVVQSASAVSHQGKVPSS